MKLNKLFIGLLITGSIFTSCSDSETIDTPKGKYDHGILISGEGSGAGTASISYISDDYQTTENFVYKKNNNDQELGTFLQSITFNKDKAYIVVDNQNKITVVDRYSFKETGSITTGLQTPRYAAIVDNMAYVTNWASTASETDDFIAFVNTDTFEVTATVAVPLGPERILEKDGNLYISHKGAWGSNNIISVINIATKAVTTITVNYIPDEMFFDNNNNLVVLCEGKAAWTGDETLASISKINLNDNSVTNITFPEGQHPSLMVENNNKIYYALGNSVYQMNTDDNNLPTSETLSTEGYFYGMEINNNTLFALNANFTDQSDLNVYNIDTKAKENTFKVSLGASKIYFNN